jgi:hypothetical protein
MELQELSVLGKLKNLSIQPKQKIFFVSKATVHLCEMRLSYTAKVLTD